MTNITINVRWSDVAINGDPPGEFIEIAIFLDFLNAKALKCEEPQDIMVA